MKKEEKRREEDNWKAKRKKKKSIRAIGLQCVRDLDLILREGRKKRKEES